MKPGYEFDVDRDFVPLCPIYHAMVYRRNQLYIVEEMKDILKNHKVYIEVKYTKVKLINSNI